MGIILSIFVIAAGGVLALSGGAGSTSGARPDSAGLVLVGAGLIWLVLSLMVSGAYRDPESEGPRVIDLRGARRGVPERHR